MNLDATDIALLAGLYVASHIIVTVVRGYLRVRKYLWYYEQEDRSRGALARGIKRRALRPLTFVLAALLAVILFLLFEYSAK